MSSFFKTVVRIIVPVVVGVLSGGNPLAIALASAATTGATGGSFKEALISGATSFVGAKIGGSLAGSFEASATAGIGETVGGFTSVVDPITGLINVVPTSTILPTVGDFLGPALTTQTSAFLQPAANLLTEAGSAFGTKTAFDVFNSLQNTTLSALGGQATGLFAGLALRDVLNAPDILGADEALTSIGFTPEAIAELRTEARKAQLQEVFERVTGVDAAGDTPIPEGITEEEFKQIIASGILRRDVDLGPGITQADFTSVFGGPGLGAELLQEETGARRDVFLGNIESSFADFPGELFNPITDDDIIAQILDERQVPIAEQISRSEARGNLNLFGGKTANLEIAKQRGIAESRLQDIGGSVLTSNLRGLQDIRTRAEQSARGFTLGDPLFDIEPFETERSEFIGGREGSLDFDIREALGAEPLFNPVEAIRAGGRLQGVVSGPPTRLLDAIAAREESAEARRRGTRGLGIAGSGVF